MSKYNDLITQLNNIKQDIGSNRALYQLSGNNSHDFDIVMNTLLYIVQNIDKLKNINNVWFPDGNHSNYAPIHLEAYADDSREPVLIGSLPQMFVTCFYKVKEAEKVKEFVDKLSGNCIDARTRSAFDFALDLTATLKFTELMEVCHKALPDDPSYFEFFAAVLKNQWGNYFKEDTGEHGIYKFKGALNSDLFKPIMHFMTDIILLEPADDVLGVYRSVEEHHKSIYLKFILEMPNLNEWLKNIKSTLSQADLDELLTRLSECIKWDKIISNPPETKFDGDEAKTVVNIYESLSPMCFHQTWPIFSSALNKGSEDELKFFSHLDARALRVIAQLISDPELHYALSTYLNEKTHSGYLDLALRADKPNLAIKLLAFTPRHVAGENIANTLQLAIKNQQLPFIEEFAKVNALTKHHFDQAIFHALSQSYHNMASLFISLVSEQTNQYGNYPDNGGARLLLYFSDHQTFFSPKNLNIAKKNY